MNIATITLNIYRRVCGGNDEAFKKKQIRT